jgi:hypothetical protein
LSGTIKETPSPDGKNRISGIVMADGQVVSHVLVSLGHPLDEDGYGEIIANTRTNKNGVFSFSGFNIPSGDYLLLAEEDSISQTKFFPLTINNQELEVTLNVQKTFDTAKPASGATVSTTPIFSWESVPDAARYLVMVHDLQKEEQVVYQMVDTEGLTLELPLAPHGEYQWMVVVFDKNGKMMNITDANVFKTE